MRLILIAVAALASIAMAAPDDERLVIATTPQSEVRSDAGLFCTTPCVTNRSQLGSKLTISRANEADVFLDPKLPKTPKGGVLDPKQNFIFEIARGFIFIALGPTSTDTNDTPARETPIR